jgi:hypothetical protein
MIEETTREVGAVGERLRYLADAYEQAQKMRIASTNRNDAGERGADEGVLEEQDPFVLELGSDLKAIERKIYREMARELKGHPAWPWLERVKGIGPTLACKILGLTSNCRGLTAHTGTVSMLWSFAGYGVEDGKRVRPKKGETRPYNTRLKTAVYLAGDSFIKSRSPYRDIYDARKEQYRNQKQLAPLREILGKDEADALEPGSAVWKQTIAAVNKEHGTETVWSDGHVDNAARRTMVKMFLSHLWEVYRDAQGLPCRPPYVLDESVPGYEGHGTYRAPEEFVD